MSDTRMVSLRYKHGRAAGACTSKIIGDTSMLLSLPNVIIPKRVTMKQNRPSVSKSSIKTPAFTRRDELSQSPFTVVGYKSELNRDHSNSQVTGAYTTATTTDASVIAAASAIDEQSYCSKSVIFNRARIVKPGSNGAIPRWRAKPFHLSNQYNHPDPMLTAGKQFMNRITQLSLLQSDTIKYENSRRKVKKSQLVQKTVNN